MVEYSSKYRDRTRFGTGGFQYFGGFGTCRARREDVVDDQYVLTANRLQICDRQGTALVAESLIH